MRDWFYSRRATEATVDQVVASGAGGGFGIDPIDGDSGYRPAGSAGRPVPTHTLEKARAWSVAGYRTNPMARAIIDTYVSFCVGDSGVSLQCSSPLVQPIVDAFWTDPRNDLGGRQELALRSHLLNGESLYEMLVGPATGVTRYSVIDPTRISDIDLLHGNPLWPKAVRIQRTGEEDLVMPVVAQDDMSGRREGQVMFWASFRALETDRRGYPFLAPVLDWLDSYDSVLSNLIDRTALARYLVWDVTVNGDQGAVDSFVKTRGGTHVPRSGSVEVHNEGVKWEPKTADTGSFEDTNTGQAILTNIAGGAGLAKTWLAESDGANRATSISMAEPVRRRVAGVQNTWLGYQTEMVRFVVDQAVGARALKPDVLVPVADGKKKRMAPSLAVSVTGPEVAAADAQVTARVLLHLSQAIDKLRSTGALTQEAAAALTRKGWEDFMGVPYAAELGEPDAAEDDVATAVDDASNRGGRPGAALAALASA